MSTSQQERDMAKQLDRSEESEQITDDDDDDDLPELVTDTDTEDNKLPELGTGNASAELGTAEEDKPKPAPRPARPPARPRRQLKPRELKLPELPTGKPPLPEGSDKHPRRRFTKGTVKLRDVRTSQLPTDFSGRSLRAGGRRILDQ
jgi:hypothetical protein